MEIAFNDVNLRNCCQSSKLLTKKYGNDDAVKIKTFLSDLRAAVSINDLQDYEHQIKGAQSLQISISETISTTINVNHMHPPTGENGRLLWDQVYRVKIMDIRQ